MSIVNPPLVPVGLRELVKNFTKDLLRNKPQNIAEYAVEYFEKMKPQEPYQVRDFELHGYGEAITKNRMLNKYPISAVFAIFPKPLTQIIKDFIKAVLRENPSNLVHFAIEYFRRLEEENIIQEVDYSSYINYTSSKNPLTVGPVGSNITCTCGRTLSSVEVDNVSPSNYEKGNTVKSADKTKIINKVSENVKITVAEKIEVKKQKTSVDFGDPQLVKSVLILQRFFRLKSKKNLLKQNQKIGIGKQTASVDLGDPKLVKSVLVLQRFFRLRIKKNLLKQNQKIEVEKQTVSVDFGDPKLVKSVLVLQKFFRLRIKKNLLKESSNIENNTGKDSVDIGDPKLLQAVLIIQRFFRLRIKNQITKQSSINEMKGLSICSREMEDNEENQEKISQKTTESTSSKTTDNVALVVNENMDIKNVEEQNCQKESTKPGLSETRTFINKDELMGKLIEKDDQSLEKNNIHTASKVDGATAAISMKESDTMGEKIQSNDGHYDKKEFNNNEADTSAIQPNDLVEINKEDEVKVKGSKDHQSEKIVATDKNDAEKQDNDELGTNKEEFMGSKVELNGTYLTNNDNDAEKKENNELLINKEELLKVMGSKVQLDETILKNNESDGESRNKHDPENKKEELLIAKGSNDQQDEKKFTNDKNDVEKQHNDAQVNQKDEQLKVQASKDQQDKIISTNDKKEAEKPQSDDLEREHKIKDEIGSKDPQDESTLSNDNNNDEKFSIETQKSVESDVTEVEPDQLIYTEKNLQEETETEKIKEEVSDQSDKDIATNLSDNGQRNMMTVVNDSPTEDKGHSSEEHTANKANFVKEVLKIEDNKSYVEAKQALDENHGNGSEVIDKIQSSLNVIANSDVEPQDLSSNDNMSSADNMEKLTKDEFSKDSITEMKLIESKNDIIKSNTDNSKQQSDNDKGTDNSNIVAEQVENSQDKLEEDSIETIINESKIVNQIDEDTTIMTSHSTGEILQGAKTQTDVENENANESVEDKNSTQTGIILKNDSGIELEKIRLDEEDIEIENKSSLSDSEISSKNLDNRFTDLNDLGNKLTPTIDTIIEEAENVIGSSYTSEGTQPTMKNTSSEGEHGTIIKIDEITTTDDDLIESNENEEITYKLRKSLSLESNETVDIANVSTKNTAFNLAADQVQPTVDNDEPVAQEIVSESENETTTNENLVKDNKAVYLDKSIKNENIQEVMQSSVNTKKNESDIIVDKKFDEKSLGATESTVNDSEKCQKKIFSQDSKDNANADDNDHKKIKNSENFSHISVENKSGDILSLSDIDEGYDERTNNLELTSLDNDVGSESNNCPASGDNNAVSEFSIEQRINKDYFYTVGDLQLVTEKPERILDVIIESPPSHETDAINDHDDDDDDETDDDAIHHNATNKLLYDILEESVVLTNDIEEGTNSLDSNKNENVSNKLELKKSEKPENVNFEQNLISDKSLLKDNEKDGVINELGKDPDKIADKNNDKISRQTVSENSSQDEKNSDVIHFGQVNSSEDEAVASDAPIDGLDKNTKGLPHHLDDNSIEANTCQNSISSGAVKCLHDQQTATITSNEETKRDNESLENNDEDDILSELKYLKPRQTRELLRSNTDSVVTQIPDTEAFIKAQQNEVSLDEEDTDNDRALFDESEINAKIHQKMFACSLSETNSDSFDVVVDRLEENGGLSRLPFNDENIKTALVNVSGTSTDTESTIVSAATKIQANTRGYLTRKRLRRESQCTKTSAQLDDDDGGEQKASFGNAAINESLENLVKDAAAKKIQKFLRKIKRRRMQSDKRGKTDGSTTSSSEYSLAARRMTLQRGDALRNDSLPDDETSSNASSHKIIKDQRRGIDIPPKSYVNTSTDRRLMWQLIRRNSMPVQIHTDVFRVVPKHMKKRVSSAEMKTNKSSTNFYN